jgi:hypothetical protein
VERAVHSSENSKNDAQSRAASLALIKLSHTSLTVVDGFCAKKSVHTKYEFAVQCRSTPSPLLALEKLVPKREVSAPER